MKKSNHISANLTNVIILRNVNNVNFTLNKMIAEYCPEINVLWDGQLTLSNVEAANKLKTNIFFVELSEINDEILENLIILLENNKKIIAIVDNQSDALQLLSIGLDECIIKPVHPAELILNVKRINKEIQKDLIISSLTYQLTNQGQEHSLIHLSNEEGIHFVNVNDIIRMNADRSYCVVYLKSGKKIMVSKPLKEIENQLPDNMFYRCHSSHLVSLNYIKQFIKKDGGCILMADKFRVPISRRRKSEFTQYIKEAAMA